MKNTTTTTAGGKSNKERSKTMFSNIMQVKEANKKLGRHVFSAETMRFFGSKVVSDLIAGQYFVTSDDNFDRTTKLFTIRIDEADGSVDTVGEFGEFETLADALVAIGVLVGSNKDVNA